MKYAAYVCRAAGTYAIIIEEIEAGRDDAFWTIPSNDTAWLEEVAKGLFQLLKPATRIDGFDLDRPSWSEAISILERLNKLTSH
jgi:hypothetical protein